MKYKKLFRFLLVCFVFVSSSLSGFGQECNRYLDQQTNVVNTKGVVLRILGKAADVILGTNFSSLTHSTNELQALDIKQYEACMKLQTIKDELNKERWGERLEKTLNQMAVLISQSGTLPSDVVKQLVASGILDPSQTQTSATISQAAPVKATNADDVPAPALSELTSAGKWEDEEPLPCQPQESDGIIRGFGWETSMDLQIARSIANMVALEDLASKIEVSVKSTAKYFIASTNPELNAKKDFGKDIETLVNQTIRGYRTVCEKHQKNSQTQKYRYFVSLEINEDAVLKPIHEKLKQDTELQKAVPNFEKFKAAFREFLD